MTALLRIPLTPTPPQAERLRAMQAAFAQMCNALAPLVASSRVWNRVALHHMAYRSLREQFPAMGSQMACNAIYAVSRMARIVYQHPASPFALALKTQAPLPRLVFSEQAPVFFDRHTLSLKDGQLSMYTLDGRMYFALPLRPESEALLRTARLREVVLVQLPDGGFELHFHLLLNPAAEEAETTDTEALPAAVLIPEYVKVEEVHP
jgi:hypothetical protein